MIFKMEVETGEDKSKKEIFWRGGGASANSIRRGAGPKKNLQICDLQRLASLIPTVELVVLECFPRCINM